MKKRMMILVIGILLIGVIIYADGVLQVNGSLGVGIAPTTNWKVNLDNTNNGIMDGAVTHTDDTTNQSAKFRTTRSNSTASSAVSWGFVNEAKAVNAADLSSTSLPGIGGGLNEIIYFYSTGLNSTIALSAGNVLDGVITIGPTGDTITVNDHVGLLSKGIRSASIGATSSMTIDRLSHVRIDDSTTGANLTMTNQYGIFINKQMAGINNYGIVLDGNESGADIVFGPNQEASIFSKQEDDAPNYVGLWVKDGGDNETQISPHDPVTGEWIYYSRNLKTGRTVRVNMEKLVKAVEKLTGEKFMIETLVEGQ